ncbi:MAG: lipid-A-disaccharide synthase [Candidatus Orphnella occulta]|nr:lipid-A-disaccharide synthase [Candidatus Orphnella occulta]
MKRILIIAGEASSDMHAADLVKEIKSVKSDVSFFGLGGNRMKEAGVDIHENIVRLAFMGPGGLFKHYLQLKKIFNTLRDNLKQNPPDLAVLIDYAEFNLRVAKELKALGVPVVYYVSPQVWAWGLWRIKTIRRLVDKMLVFFKFEETLYKEHGVNVSFVGHPLLDMVKTTSKKEAILKKLGIEKDFKVIGLLPGSRESEIKNILPVMLESAKLILNTFNQKIRFVLPMAATVNKQYVKQRIKNSGVDVIAVENDTYNAVSVCNCAMVTSGTATLETALLNVPMAIIYKANFLNYILTKHLIKLPYIGLVNVISGKHVVKEFLQYEATSEKIADYMKRLITDEKLIDKMKQEFLAIRLSLEEPGAVTRAAKEVADFLN